MGEMTLEQKKKMGQAIKRIRKKRGLSQEEFAVILGYQTGTVSKFEQGDRTPNISTILQMANILECNVTDILSPTENETPSIKDNPALLPFIKFLKNSGIESSIVYSDGDKSNEKLLIELDGQPYLLDKIEPILQLTLEHFKLTCKQFGEQMYYEKEDAKNARKQRQKNK
jgi:transcriptional regulator with XRE-family HTH domain